MTPYEKYLKSDHWKQLRERAVTKANRKCELCRYPNNIEVHHLMYRRLYDVTLDDLITLCAACHSRAHSWITWGEIVNGETSEQRRHDLIVKFSGVMNRCREIRRRPQPKPTKAIKRQKRPVEAEGEKPDPYLKLAKTALVPTAHLHYCGDGVWTHAQA